MALNALGLGLLFTAKDLASGVMGKVRNGFAQTRDEFGKFGSRSREAFEDFGLGMKIMGAGLLGLGALASTIPAAATFGQKIAEISTLTEEASLNTAFLGDEVLRLNAKYGGSTAKQAKGLYDGISAGAANAAEATALMEASNKLAVAGVTEVNVALDGLTSSLNAYGVKFSEASKFSDSMFVAVRQGKTTIGDLASTIGRVAPLASSMGVSFDELTASIAAGTTKGLKTEEAITGMKAALVTIIKPAGDATAEASRLGIKFDQAALRSKGFTKFITDITDNKKLKADSLSKLFGGSAEALNLMLGLAANKGSKFKETLAEMAQKSGKTNTAFEIMSQTLAFQGKRFEGLKENATIMIGQALEPIAAAVVGVANTVLEAFTSMPKPMRDFMVKAFAVASAIVTAVGAVIAAKAAILIFAASLKFAGAGVAGLAATILPAIAIVALLGATIYAFKYAIDRNLDGIGDKFHAFVDGIHLAFDAAVQLFTDGGFSGAVREEFLKGENPFINFAVKVYLIVGRIKNFLSGFAEGFHEALEQIDFASLVTALSDLGASLGLISNNVEESGASFTAWGVAGSKVGDLIGRIIEIVVTVITAAVEIVTGFITTWKAMPDVFGPVSDSFHQIGTAISDIVTALGFMSGSVTDGGNGWQVFGGVIAAVVVSALRMAGAVIQFVANMIQDLAMVVTGVTDVIGGIMDGDWARVWQGMRKVVFGVVQGIMDMVWGMVGGIAAAIDALGSLAGKDIGAGKAVKGLRDEQKAALQDALGITSNKVTSGPVTNPAPQTAITANNSPAIATFNQNASVDPSLVEAAAARGAAAKGASGPQTAIAKVYLDKAQIAEAVASFNSGDGARGYGMSSPSSE